MTDLALHALLVQVVYGCAALSAFLLLFVSAPYGRHERKGWGPTIPSRLGWIGMETPAVLFFAYVYFQGAHAWSLAPLCMFALWQVHYVHRTYIFPFRTRSGGKRMPLFVAALAFLFQCVNSWINASWISHFGDYPDSWLADPRFFSGATLFVAGWVINLVADTQLIRLRAPGDTGYKIPRGFLYRYVTCPNYLGELMEWCGWALMTYSAAGLSFAVFTIANLAPRAVSHHRWYRETFADYPSERRALIPFLL